MPGLQLMDTTIRDGQQSLWATRMSLGDMLPILPKMDKVGYWAVEAWGGATFDTCLRFLDENPWERLRSIKAHMPNTDLAMLSRGQNLVGYKHYSKDIVNRFIACAKKDGIQVFRVFDATLSTTPRLLRRAAAGSRALSLTPYRPCIRSMAFWSMPRN